MYLAPSDLRFTVKKFKVPGTGDADEEAVPANATVKRSARRGRAVSGEGFRCGVAEILMLLSVDASSSEESSATEHNSSSGKTRLCLN